MEKKEPCGSLYRTNHSVAVSIFSSSKCWSALLEEFYKRILRPRSADNASCVCCMLVGRTFHSYHLHILQVFDGFLQRPAWRLRVGNCGVQPGVPNLEDKSSRKHGRLLNARSSVSGSAEREACVALRV